MKLLRARHSDTQSTAAEPRRELAAPLAKTRASLSQGLRALWTPRADAAWDAAWVEQLETELLRADVGVATTQQVVQRLQPAAGAPKPTAAARLQTLKAVLLEGLSGCQQPLPPRVDPTSPSVILLVGVNGVGKTTLCAKLAARAQADGQRVMLAACDTFRAAAIEQLKAWGQRLGVPVISQHHAADAAAVAYDAYAAAQARNIDLLLIDSAGRQHTDTDLMQQLAKLKRVLGKAAAHLPEQIWLVVDATNGQNVLSQVEHFNQALGLDGICVTKLDGSAKGGVLLALAARFGLPIHYLGVGEAVDDLCRFDAARFIDALLPPALGPTSVTPQDEYA